eukprot:364111-Chlamydomonas_euryale.AAC.1
MRDWDWAPLTECLVMQHMSALGGRNMALDCAVALQLLCGAPELSIADGACAAVVAGGGLPRLVALLEERVSHPLAVGAALSVMYAVCRRNPMALARQLLVDEQGLQVWGAAVESGRGGDGEVERGWGVGLECCWRREHVTHMTPPKHSPTSNCCLHKLTKATSKLLDHPAFIPQAT